MKATDRLAFHDLPLFGRSKELAVLSDAYSRAKQQHHYQRQEGAATPSSNRIRSSTTTTITTAGPQIVFISGRSGTGKSHLVKHLMKQQIQLSPEDFVVGKYKTYYCSGKFKPITVPASLINLRALVQNSHILH
jgi:Cdc6-like AAA superfamily ATPase